MSTAGTYAKRAGFALMATLVLLEIVLAAALFVASHTGHRFIVVTGGSMEPTIGVGSALLIEDVAPEDVRPGTVVTYRSVDGVLTTHRVIALRTVAGQSYAQTQGDANDKPDPNLAAVDSVIGSPRMEVPRGGYLATFLLSPTGRWIVFGPPLIVLLCAELLLVRARLREEDSEDTSGEHAQAGADDDTNEDTPARSDVPLAARSAHMTSDADSAPAYTLRATPAPTRSRLTVVVIVLATLAAAAAVYIPRSNALFVGSANIGANTFTSTAVAPATALTATVAGANVNLSWTASPTPFKTGYAIGRSATNGGPYTTIGTAAAGATTFTDLSASGTVYYRIFTMAENWVSAGSNQATATIVALPPVTSPVYNCSAQSVDTGGDGDGFETTPLAACGAPNTVYASDKQSGTNSVISCTDPGKDRHRFSTFGINLLPTSTITGVQVSTTGFRNKTSSASVCVQLSGNNGATWTTPKSAVYAGVSTIETLTFGGPADLWGQTWTPATLANGQFLVRIINIDDSQAQTFFLDSVQVRVTYR